MITRCLSHIYDHRDSHVSSRAVYVLLPEAEGGVGNKSCIQPLEAKVLQSAFIAFSDAKIHFYSNTKLIAHA